jgi:hypothetical protein
MLLSGRGWIRTLEIRRPRSAAGIAIARPI